MGWVGLDQSADGFGWIGSHKMDPRATVLYATVLLLVVFLLQDEFTTFECIIIRMSASK